MVFATAGDPTSSRTLRDAIGSVAVLQNDISVTSLETFVDCPGLAVPLDAAGFYQVDGYIAYSSATAADIQFSYGIPPDSLGHNSHFPVFQTVAASSGDMEAFRQVAFNDANPQGAAGAGTGTPMATQPHGWFWTFRFGGSVQLRFAQITSTASATVVRAGSWIRATKMFTYTGI